MKYLSEIKWPDEAFVCARCGNATYHKGRTPYSRRCNKCKHDESVTAGTMLDRMKLAPLFAFHIAFKIATKKKGMSSLELAEEYELRQKTVWEFKWKLQQAMKSSGKYPLTGNVHVDEFYIGGEEEGITGRSSESAKKLVVVALEIVTDGVGRAYAQVIDDVNGVTLASASTLDKEFEGAAGNCEAAKKVGLLVAQRAKEKGISVVVFDRGGYIYHGRVAALAEGAREGGLEF